MHVGEVSVAVSEPLSLPVHLIPAAGGTTSQLV